MFRAAVPGGLVRTFQRSAHFAYLEEPDDYAAAVTEFRVLEKSGLIQVDGFASAEPDAAKNAEQDHVVYEVVYELTRADWAARAR